MQLAERLHVGPLLRIKVWEPWGVLVPLVGLQWLLLGAFVLTVRHNGWLFYQGGDETFFYTSSWSIAHGHIPDAAIGWSWSYLLAPVAAVFSTNFLAALPAIVLIQTIVLLPLGLLALYGLGTRIGGRLFGYLVATLWVVGPYALIPLWDGRYHQKYVEQFLPQAFGLTGLGDFPSMILAVCVAYLVVRALDERSLPLAALGGVTAAFMIGVKPANALLLVGVVPAFAVSRRWREGLVYGAAMVPGLLALALWKYKGLGSLPVLHSSGTAAAASAPALLASLHLPRSVKLDWHHFGQNLDNLREFFWSVRVVEWFAVAGVIGLLRRSPAKALLVGGWFAAFLVIKGTSPRASIEAGTLLRLFMPALPALLILVAGVTLLVPGYSTRLATRFPAAAPAPPGPRSHGLAAAVLVLGVLPVILFAALPPLKSAQAAKFFANNTYVPVSSTQLSLRAVARPDGVLLRWQAPPASAKVFYRVFRAPHDFVYDARFPHWIDGLHCLPPTRGAADCSVQMQSLAVTAQRSFLDRAALTPGTYAYRVGVMANWVNDLSGGDVLFVSAPALVTKR
jgi:hypothetical protein